MRNFIILMTQDRLQFLYTNLIRLSNKYNWHLQAWAIFSNHYHFIAQSPDNPANLSAFISELHVTSAKYINQIDKTTNRMVWWQFWDTYISYQYSYFARINYVIQNPVRHGLVKEAADYPWCSANWLRDVTSAPFYKTITSFKIDKVNVIDDF